MHPIMIVADVDCLQVLIFVLFNIYHDDISVRAGHCVVTVETKGW